MQRTKVINTAYLLGHAKVALVLANGCQKLWHAQASLKRLALQGQHGQAKDHHAGEHSSAAALAAIDHAASSSGATLSSASLIIAAEIANLVADNFPASDAASSLVALI